jgi:S-DNA-T family DNA segregation ATPase FtsK/SpoIIIE
VLAAAGGFTLVAVASPGGSLTQRWAAQAIALAGWAAAPWCAVALAAGLALYHGRRALRRAVAGRLAGAALLLLAAAGLHQLASAPPPPWLGGTSLASAASLLSAPPGVDGYVGLLFGTAMAALFGIQGAAGVLALVAGFGFGLLCGWSLKTWQRLGGQTAAGARRAGHTSRAAAILIGRAAHALLRLAATVVIVGARYTRSTAVALAARYRAWRAASALRAERQAAAWAAARTAAAALADPAAPDAALDIGLITDPAAGSGGITVAPIAPPAAPPEPYTAAGSWPTHWHLPSTAMLSATTAEQISEAEIAEKARLIERTLGAFNVPVTVKDTRIGPRVTQFLLRPAEGVSVKKIKAFEADLQLVLAAQTLRIELPVPGRPVVGIEIPNSGIAHVGLREILESPQFREAKGRLRLALGRDVDGNARVGDLARMPHLLIAGQTGSGKSFCVNSIIASLLFQCTPDELNLVMIDPKMVEMAEYDGIPHLRYPVVIDLAEAGKVLLWAVEEMERRYRVMAEAGYRHIDAYNRSLATAPRATLLDSARAPFRSHTPPPKPFPYLVIIIDELADLMMFAPDDVEPAICRLTAKARAVGMHLVVATQRPSVDVVTGLIKANMPSRIAFAVASQIDSRVILDVGGAESLLGRGDMLYLPYDQGKPIRVQGTYMADDEISALIHFWKKQGSPNYVQKEEIDALTLKHEAPDADKAGEKQSPLLERAIAVLHTTNYVSVSFLQRKLGVGYPRAARLMDELEERGLVEADESNGRSYRVLAEALPESGDPETA